MVLTEGQVSDFKGAALMIAGLIKAKVMLGDRGCDADWFMTALSQRGITPCIPSKSNRIEPAPPPPTGGSTASDTASKTCSAA